MVRCVQPATTMRLFFVVVLVLASRRAEADCGLPSTACEAAQRAKVIFVGTVTKVVRPARAVEATLTVDELFAGTVGRSVRIQSKGVDAYGHFAVGDKLLVYAGQAADGTLQLSGCSRTGPLPLRAADVRELRAAAKRGIGLISGLVMVDGLPRSNVEVRIPSLSKSTLTNVRGEYAFEVPPGTHVVEPARDPRFAPRTNTPVAVRMAGCVKQDFPDRWNGRVSGRLTDITGAPVANAIVHAFPAGSKVPEIIERGSTWLVSTSTRSNAQGEYEIGPLRPGTYHVAVGAPFELDSPYPPTYHAANGAAIGVTLNRGKLATNIDLVVPPRLQLFKITARVRVTGTIPSTGLDATLTDTRTGRVQRSNITTTTAAELSEVAGTVVELKVCATIIDCVSQRLTLDKDLAVELALDIH